MLQQDNEQLRQDLNARLQAENKQKDMLQLLHQKIHEQGHEFQQYSTANDSRIAELETDTQLLCDDRCGFHDDTVMGSSSVYIYAW